LSGVTATMNPPRNPANNEGYFEYIEGPVTQATAPSYAVNGDISTSPQDTTVGDFDDILMFTTRSTGRQFVGMCGGNTIQSDVAEVAWFVRGRTLYRRVLLVSPSTNVSRITAPYYANCDISACVDSTGTLRANSLADLTRRECRFAHGSSTFPYDVRGWCWTHSSLNIPTLPTLDECSYAGWTVNKVPVTTGSIGTLDFWTNVSGYRLAGNTLNAGNDGTRVADDVILTNVIGFDVKAWDSTYVDPTTGLTGGYVDLGYAKQPYSTSLGQGFGHWGTVKSGLNGNLTTACVYDSYSTSYEGDAAHNGLDDPGTDENGNSTPIGVGIVDDDTEKAHIPPYPVPLRGIQVKIRVFEPDSKQVREVTVVQDFLPQ
jgi:hypothetical protein